MAKIYTLSDLAKIQSLAVEMGLKVWRVENVQKDELIKISPLLKAPEQLERIFKYLESELVPDGKYILIGKTGQKSIPTTNLTVVKGDEDKAGTNHYSTTLAYKDYNAVIQDNAKLKADNYYMAEQIKVLHEQIAELRQELDEQDDEDEEKSKNSVYEDLAKEYAPQILNLVTQYFGPKSQPTITSFADAPPPSAPVQKIIRFTPEYNAYWQKCTDQNAVNQEYQYIATNRPDKLEAFTKLFNGATTTD